MSTSDSDPYGGSDEEIFGETLEKLGTYKVIDFAPAQAAVQAEQAKPKYDIDMDDFALEIDLSNFEVDNSQQLALDQQEDLMAAGQEEPDYQLRTTDIRNTLEDIYSYVVLDKARDLLRGDRVQKIKDREGGGSTWEVIGSELYIDTIHAPMEGMPIPWVECTCPNGGARGGRPTCYHSAAVLMRALKLDDGADL